MGVLGPWADCAVPRVCLFEQLVEKFMTGPNYTISSACSSAAPTDQADVGEGEGGGAPSQQQGHDLHINVHSNRVKRDLLPWERHAMGYR